MNIQKTFPYLVAGYLVFVGLFFIIFSLFDMPLLNAEPPGSYILSVISVTFITVGICYIVLLHMGKLTKSGKSFVEIRIEAIEKIKDPTMLSKIALEDSNPECRKAAQKRLEDLKIIQRS
jgi:hypothetical protein